MIGSVGKPETHIYFLGLSDYLNHISSKEIMREKKNSVYMYSLKLLLRVLSFPTESINS